MLSYRDMTFCPFNKDCNSAHMCPRALTDEVKEKAQRFNLPISMFGSKPGCWSLKQPIKNTAEVEA